MSNSQPIILHVPPDCSGMRLDQALQKMLPEHSRSRLQTWIKAQHVLLNQQPSNAKSKVWEGDQISVQEQAIPQSMAFAAEAIALNIVYEDDAILVINKPAGMVVHPAAGNWSGTLLNALLHHHPALADIPRAGIVPRLDKDTSGVMIVAKTDDAHLKVSEAIAAREVKRFYIAIVSGMFVHSQIKVENLIAKSRKDRTKMCIVKSGGKVAISNYEVLGRNESKFTMLGCSLETGRTHQIRCQLSNMGYPIVGDALYGGNSMLNRQALHAYSIEFNHPISGEYISFSVKPPQDMIELIDNLHISSKYDFR